MLYSIAIIVVLFVVKEAIEEKHKNTIPDDARFNWGEYWADVRSGMTTMEQVKKRQNGSYMTLPESTDRENNNFDNIRYEADKALYGEAIAEIWKKNGSYKIIR